MGWGAFNNPIVNGLGSLIIDMIQSANFSIANRTGWQITKEGGATFYSVSVNGGTLVVSGPGQGVFFYSGTPATGNLVASLSAMGVNLKDPYGNNYSAVLDISGLLVLDTNGNIGQFNVPGATQNLLSNGSGLLIYIPTGTAVQGAPVITAAPANIPNDGFGNAINEGLTISYLGSVPTGNPPNHGVTLYVDSSGNLLARTSAGNVRTVAAV